MATWTKFAPLDQREAEMRRTVISSVNRKLERMTLDQLRRVLLLASEIIEQECKGKKPGV